MLAEGTLTYDEIKSERARINQKRIEAENAKYKDYIEIDSAFSCELNSNKYSETHISSGDINSDGKADLSDLSEISLAILGDKSFTDAQKKAADVDGDGELSLADLAKFKQYITKQIESLG